MSTLQEHLPKERTATAEEEWGFTLWEFVEGNWVYLLGLLILLVLFFYARYSWRKRNQR